MHLTRTPLSCLLFLAASAAQAFQWEALPEPAAARPSWATSTAEPVNQRVAPDGTRWVLRRDSVNSEYQFTRGNEVFSSEDPIHMNWIEYGFDWDFTPDGTMHIIWTAADFFNDGNPYQGWLPEELALWYRSRSPSGVWSDHQKLLSNPILIDGETTTLPYTYRSALATGPQGQVVVAWSSNAHDGIRLLTLQNNTWVPSIVDHPNPSDPLSNPLQMQITRNGALHIFYSGPPAPGSPLDFNMRVARRVFDTWADELVSEADAVLTFSKLSDCGCYPIATKGEFWPNRRTIFRPIDLRDADGDGFPEVVEAALGSSDANAASLPKIVFEALPDGGSRRPRFGFVGPSAAEYITYSSNHIFKRTPTLFFPERGIHIVVEWSDRLDGWSDSPWSSNPTFPTLVRGNFPNFIVNKAVWFDALQTVEQIGPRRFFRLVCWRDE